MCPLSSIPGLLFGTVLAPAATPVGFPKLRALFDGSEQAGEHRSGVLVLSAGVAAVIAPA